MERENGFLKLQKYKMIRQCLDNAEGHYCDGWIEIENTEYIFKKYQEIKTCYKEVVWSYILKELGIPNVGYDLANLNGQYGVITPILYKDNSKKNLLELVVSFRQNANLEYRYSSFQKLYNVKDLEKVLTFAYQDKLSATELNLLNFGLLEQFIIQLISGNCDLHARNIMILEEPTIRFFPFYDFGGYNLTDFKITNKRSFCLSYHEVPYLVPPKKTLQTFLDFANQQELEILKKYLESIHQLNLKQIYEKMENHISYQIPRNLKKDLSRKITQNSTYISKQLRKR
jgi:hypothetical protein